MNPGVLRDMDEQPNLREFLNEVSSFSEESEKTPAKSSGGQLAPVGAVFEIAGSGSQIRMDAAALSALQSHKDQAVAMAGQVGSQVKMGVGNSWLIANVRTLRAEGQELIANVDFLGEGAKEASGKMSN